MEGYLMIKEIHWGNIPENVTGDIGVEPIISNEMNIRQNVDTSDQIAVQEHNEQTSGNEITTSNMISIATKFSSVFQTSNKYEAHPFAEIFHDATKLEFESLLEDMRVHEQYEPIIIFEGKIADGRTRKKVQDELKHTALAHEWLGSSEELLNYLYAKSQHRNLNSQQRAVISLQFLKAEKDLAKQRQGMRTDLNNIVSAIQRKSVRYNS
jgi:hypothetical protein